MGEQQGCSLLKVYVCEAGKLIYISINKPTCCICATSKSRHGVGVAGTLDGLFARTAVCLITKLVMSNGEKTSHSSLDVARANELRQSYRHHLCAGQQLLLCRY